MRNNLLTEINVRLNLSTLSSVDLYENQITKIEHLEHLVNLRTLDLSHNRYGHLYQCYLFSFNIIEYAL